MSISGSGRSGIGRDDCEVYVWGSNNSHQLAEGSQEKILSPKLTSSFGSVQQVCLCRHIAFGFVVWYAKELFYLLNLVYFVCFCFSLLLVDPEDALKGKNRRILTYPSLCCLC